MNLTSAEGSHEVNRSHSFSYTIAFFVFSFLFLHSCSKKAETTKPEIGSITESVYASGTVKSENQYQVFPKTNGILQTLFVHEGDLIQNQQILFAISNETSKLSRENAQLLAEFNDFDNNSDKLRDIKLTVDLARNKMKTDSISYQRKRALFENNVISKNDMEQIELAYQNSKSAYNSALLRSNELKKQLSFSDKQAKRNLQISQNMENDFLVKSEIKGRIYAILKEKGEMVNAQTPVAIVGDAENFKVEMQIDENDITKVKAGQKIIIALDSYKDKTFDALVTKVNPYLNEKTKTFIIEAQFTQVPDVLYPNLTLEANIVVDHKENVMLIPRKYLLDNNYVQLENGKKVKVKTGLMDYEKVEIVSGLSKNDVLIFEK